MTAARHSRDRKRDGRRKGERGVALLLALFVMVLLAVVTIEFTVSSQVGYRRAAMWLAGRGAALVADGGIALAGEVLRQDFQINSSDSFGDIWARELPPIETGAGMLAVRIEDEQGKLNLNSLTSGALSPAGRAFQTLLGRLGLDPSLASPLADWVDRNHETGAGPLAAEDAWYANQTPPYKPRNGPLRSFSEVALIRGFTPAVLAKLRRHATVLVDADMRINVNTASPEVLASIDPRLDDDALVRQLVDVRTATPFEKAASLMAAPGMDGFSSEEIDKLFRFSSRYFRVRATGETRGAMRSVEALVERDSSAIKVVYLLPRRGPNIVGLDSGLSRRIDDAGLFGASPR